MNKSELKVLFVLNQANATNNRDGESIQEWTKPDVHNVRFPTPIKVDFIGTNNNTIDQVTKLVTSGLYDAIVVDETHYFINNQASNPNNMHAGYEQLGLNFVKKNAWGHDPNLPYTGIKLVDHFKRAFENTLQASPKFGYIPEWNTSKSIENKFQKLNMESNADFYIDVGNEGPDQHVEAIYQACGIS